jgi:hypothetical protein
MIHRISFIFVLALALVLAPVSTVSAASLSVSTTFDLSGLPPGIAVKVEPLLAKLLGHHEMGMGEGMSHEHMEAHLTQFQQMIDQLPPGIVVGILEILVDSPCMVMMHFHHAVEEEGLLDQPPGQILKFVKTLGK